MNFKVDENLPQEIASILTEAGHDALTAADQGLGGASDRALWTHCLLEHRSLLTLDLDFSDIRVYLPEARYGIIVFRTPSQDKHRLITLARQVIPMLALEPLHDRLWIVEEGRVRVRSREGP